MDFDRMADELMMQSNFPLRTSLMNIPCDKEEEEFFKGLPVAARPEDLKPVETTESPPASSEQALPRGYTSYSYSSSSILDDQGQRVESKRRRYEDSTGKLKAVHERKIGDKVFKTVWNKKNEKDEGKHESLCSSGTSEDFEKLWLHTPFGKKEETSNLLEEKKEEL